MCTILKFDFQKRKELCFSKVNYLNYTKRNPNFACDKYIFPKTRGNKNKQCTHSTPLNTTLNIQLMSYNFSCCFACRGIHEGLIFGFVRNMTELRNKPK